MQHAFYPFTALPKGITPFDSPVIGGRKSCSRGEVHPDELHAEKTK